MRDVYLLLTLALACFGMQIALVLRESDLVNRVTHLFNAL